MHPTARKKAEQLVERVKKVRRGNAANLVCADCPCRSTAYVVLKFATFVCSACAGIHRGFSHKMKVVGMTDFTLAEVVCLEAGGNELSNSHYLGRYKEGRETYQLPREDERDRMREFLDYKYIQKKWYTERIKKKSKTKKRRKREENKETEAPKYSSSASEPPTMAAATSATAVADDDWDAFGPDDFGDTTTAVPVAATGGGDDLFSTAGYEAPGAAQK